MTPWTREEAEVLLDAVEQEWREMPEEQRERLRRMLDPETEAELKKRQLILATSNPALRDD